MTKAIAVAGLAAVAAMAAACTPSTVSSAPAPQVVLAIAHGFSNTVQVKTGDEVDPGLPELATTPATRHPVHLRWVSIPGQPGIRVDSITAYRYHGYAIGGKTGNLLTGNCRRIYLPRPVSDVVVLPHAALPKWFVVVGFTLTRPGTYHVNRVKIGYRVSGHDGWQWQNLNLTVDVTKARRGAKPVAADC